MITKSRILYGGSLFLMLVLPAFQAEAFSKAELHKACLDMLQACESYCDKTYSAGSNAHKNCNKDCKKQYDECGEKAWNMPSQEVKKPSKKLHDLQPAE